MFTDNFTCSLYLRRTIPNMPYTPKYIEMKLNSWLVCSSQYQILANLWYDIAYDRSFAIRIQQFFTTISCPSGQPGEPSSPRCAFHYEVATREPYSPQRVITLLTKSSSFLSFFIFLRTKYLQLSVPQTRILCHHASQTDWWSQLRS